MEPYPINGASLFNLLRSKKGDGIPVAAQLQPDGIPVDIDKPITKFLIIRKNFSFFQSIFPSLSSSLSEKEESWALPGLLSF